MKNHNGGRVPNRKLDNEWMGLTFNVEKEEMKWLHGSYVAQTFNPEGVFNCKITYIWKVSLPLIPYQWEGILFYFIRKMNEQ